jgi:hypothetical protein
MQTATAAASIVAAHGAPHAVKLQLRQCPLLSGDKKQQQIKRPADMGGCGSFSFADHEE